MAYPGFVDEALQKEPLANQNEICTEENDETAVFPQKNGVTIHGLFQKDIFIPSEAFIAQLSHYTAKGHRIILFGFEPEKDLLQYFILRAAEKPPKASINSFMDEIDSNPFIYQSDIAELKRNLLAVKKNKQDADFYLRIVSAPGRDIRWYHVHLIRPVNENSLLVGWANDHEAESVVRPLELQIALAVRNAYPDNTVFFSAYDLTTDEVLHFSGELIPDTLRQKEKFSDIKSYYLDYVHENDVKSIIYTEFRLRNASTAGMNGKEISFECRIIPPSDAEKKYIWVEVTFRLFMGESGKQICSVMARNITEQKLKNEELLRLASRDPFSTILPRMTFEEFCLSQNTNTAMEGWLNAILLIDFNYVGKKSLEGIKHIDLLDMISKKTEPVLTKYISEKTIVARFSNTMYLMSMHDLPSVNALRERVFSLQDKLIRAVNDKDLAVCIGVALCHHDKGSGFRCVYDDVEKALKSARKTGKSQVMFYKLGMDANSDEASVADKRKSVFIRTFSNFEVFVDDTPINFRNKKTKELLAILVDRRGGFVSNTEAAEMLWEDEPVNKQIRARFRKVAMWLNNTLAEYGVEDIIEVNGRSRRLCADKVSCDLYNYLSHKEKYADTYGGFYMNEYSWAEFTTAELNKELFIE